MSTGLTLSTEKKNFALAVSKAGSISKMPNDITKSLYMADAVNELRTVMRGEEIANVLIDLQNTGVGFKTDKADVGYPINVLVDCAIEALSMGLYLHGNEWNIIGSNCYPAQRGFERLLREHCAKFSIKRHFKNHIPKFIEKKGNQSVFEVQIDVSWKTLQMEKRETEILKWHLVGLTNDQVIGKAKKRAFQWLYNELTNNALPIDDEGDFDVIDGGDLIPSESGELVLSPEVLAELKQSLMIVATEEAEYLKTVGVDSLEKVQLEKAMQLINHVKANA
jgi:hypothetical protein